MDTYPSSRSVAPYHKGRWGNPVAQYQNQISTENDIASSQTNNIVNMLSDDTKNPTRIKVDGVYWSTGKSKAYHSAPVIITGGNYDAEKEGQK